MILLGVECGFIVSTATHLFGSYLIGFMSLLPHGVIEIPAISLAGAIPFSGHLRVKSALKNIAENEMFEYLQTYRNELPVRFFALSIILCLLIAGFIEAHITQKVVDFLFPKPV